MLRHIGSGNVRVRRDLPRFIRMHENRWVAAEPIIHRTLSLDGINDALQVSIDQRDPSGIIVPSL